MGCGCFALVPAVAGLLSLFGVFFGSTWCRTFEIRPLDPSMPVFETGLAAYRTSTEFIRYETETQEFWFEDNCREFVSAVDLDRTWRVVVALQVACWFVAMLLSFALFVSMCCRFSRSAYASIGILWLIVCCPASGLIMLMMQHSKVCTQNPVIVELLAAQQRNDTSSSSNSNNYDDLYEDSCHLGRGAIPYIIGVAGFFLTGIMTLCMAMRKSSDSNRNDNNNADNKSITNEDNKSEQGSNSPSVHVHVNPGAYVSNMEKSTTASGSATGSVDGTNTTMESTPSKDRNSNANYDDNPFTSA